MKIVVVSDLHLDRVTYGVERFDEVKRALGQAVAHAIGHRVGLFACLGDVCNPGTSRSHRSVAACVEAARQLKEADVPSVWLVGNHDVVEDGSGDDVLMPLEEAGHRVIRKPQVWGLVCDYPTGLLNVLMLPHVPRCAAYDPAKCVTDAAEIKQRVDVVFGHLSIPGVAGGSESSEMARGRQMLWLLAELRRCYPDALLVGGHVHAPGLYEGIHVIGSPAVFTSAESGCVPSFSVFERAA